MKTAREVAGINPAQIKKLHALKTALSLDDAAYRTALAACGVTTSKALTFSGAAELIEDFEQKAIKSGAWKRLKRPATESRRTGFASPAQKALIESLWDEVSTAPNKKAALRRFITRQAKVSDPQFLRDCDASKVICAIKAMRKHKQNRMLSGSGEA